MTALALCFQQQRRQTWTRDSAACKGQRVKAREDKVRSEHGAGGRQGALH